MTISESQLRSIRQRAIFNGTVPRADIIALVDTIRDLRATLAADTPEACCATEPHLCDHSDEQANPDAPYRRVCLTHDSHQGDQS